MNHNTLRYPNQQLGPNLYYEFNRPTGYSVTESNTYPFAYETSSSDNKSPAQFLGEFAVDTLLGQFGVPRVTESTAMPLQNPDLGTVAMGGLLTAVMTGERHKNSTNTH